MNYAPAIVAYHRFARPVDDSFGPVRRRPRSGCRRISAEKPNLKILTWNIQMLPTYGFLSEDLQKKQAVCAPWIIEYLDKQDYDIIALEEIIDRKITEDLKAGLKTRYPHIVAPPSKSGISGTSGGILLASRIPLKYVSRTSFTRTWPASIGWPKRGA